MTNLLRVTAVWGAVVWVMFLAELALEMNGAGYGYVQAVSQIAGAWVLIGGTLLAIGYLFLAIRWLDRARRAKVSASKGSLP